MNKSQGTKKKKTKLLSDLSHKDFMKAFEEHKKKVSKFKYNVRKDMTMKKCNNFCKNDYLPEIYKKIPTNLKSLANKNKTFVKKLHFGLCKRDFCNEGCAEGFDFDFVFGDKEKHKKKFQKRFSKKLYNGFVDSYSAKEVEMLKKRGALSGCGDQLMN